MHDDYSQATDKMDVISLKHPAPALEKEETEKENTGNYRIIVYKSPCFPTFILLRPTLSRLYLRLRPTLRYSL